MTAEQNDIIGEIQLFCLKGKERKNSNKALRGEKKNVSTNATDIKESEGKLKITIGQAGHLLKNLLLLLTAGKKNERDANNCSGSMKSAFCLFPPPFLNSYSMQNLGESQSMQRGEKKKFSRLCI